MKDKVKYPKEALKRANNFIRVRILITFQFLFLGVMLLLVDVWITFEDFGVFEISSEEHSDVAFSILSDCLLVDKIRGTHGFFALVDIAWCALALLLKDLVVCLSSLLQQIQIILQNTWIILKNLMDWSIFSKPCSGEISNYRQ